MMIASVCHRSAALVLSIFHYECRYSLIVVDFGVHPLSYEESPVFIITVLLIASCFVPWMTSVFTLLEPADFDLEMIDVQMRHDCITVFTWKAICMGRNLLGHVATNNHFEFHDALWTSLMHGGNLQQVQILSHTRSVPFIPVDVEMIGVFGDMTHKFIITLGA